MDKLTDFTDTSDVSDAAIEWAVNLTKGSDSVAHVRRYASHPEYPFTQIRIVLARLIQQHRPDLLVDPVDAIVREELARAYVGTGASMTAEFIRSGRYDCQADFIAAKRLYLMGIEKGKAG